MLIFPAVIKVRRSQATKCCSVLTLMYWQQGTRRCVTPQKICANALQQCGLRISKVHCGGIFTPLSSHKIFNIQHGPELD